MGFSGPLGRGADEQRAPFGRGCPWREGTEQAPWAKGLSVGAPPLKEHCEHAVAHSQARRRTRQNSFARQSSSSCSPGLSPHAISSGRAPKTPHRHFPIHSANEQTRHDHANDTPTRTPRTWTTPRYLDTNFSLLPNSRNVLGPHFDKNTDRSQAREPSLLLYMGAPKSAEQLLENEDCRKYQFQAFVNSFS